MEPKYKYLRTIVPIAKILAIVLVLFGFVFMLIAIFVPYIDFSDTFVVFVGGFALFAEAEMILVFLSMEAGINKISQLLEGMQKEEK